MELEVEAQVWQAEGRRYDTKGVSGGSLASFFSHLNSGMTAILALCFHPQLALFSLHCTFFISIELQECGLSKKAINRYDIHERANCLTPLGSAPFCLPHLICPCGSGKNSLFIPKTGSQQAKKKALADKPMPFAQ